MESSEQWQPEGRQNYYSTQNLHGLILRAALPTKVEVSAGAMAVDGRQRHYVTLQLQ